MMNSEVRSNNGCLAGLEALIQDPVSLEHMRNPCVDKHGHTFSMDTVNSLVQRSLSVKLELGHEKDGFVCPLALEWVILEDLYPNLAVRDITEGIRDFEEKHEQALKDQEKALLRATDEIVEKVAGRYQNIIDSLEKKHSDLENQYKRVITGLENRCAVLEQRNVELEEQVQQEKLLGKEKNNTINLQAEKIVKKKKALEEQKRTLEMQTKDIEEKNKTIEEKNKTIEKQKKDVKEKNEAIATQVKTINQYIDTMKSRGIGVGQGNERAEVSTALVNLTYAVGALGVALFSAIGIISK